jgi:hypothetical protein
MPKNNLQILFNEIEQEARESESVFLAADKHRHSLKAAYAALLTTLNGLQARLVKYPQAASLKRLKLIETLLQDLLLRHETERRHFNALGFLLGRLRSNLATEMLEPRLYNKIRAALETETALVKLREKYPDADAVVTQPPQARKPRSKPVKLLLVASAGVHFAVPVQKVVKKASPGPITEKLQQIGYLSSPLPISAQNSALPKLAVAYIDPKGQKKMLVCDEYFTPVQMSQKSLKDRVDYSGNSTGKPGDLRPQLAFYGRRFFLYGARLSYTVRPGERTRPS